MPPNMFEAMRLARAGQPAEATTVLRRMLAGERLAPRISGRGPPLVSPTAAPPAGRFVDGAYGDAAGKRAYKLYLPSGERAGPLPLVVMLHGCTQSPDDFAAGTRMNAVAEREGCLVVYPAQPASANCSRCWNWFRAGDQERDRGEPSLVAGITRQILRDHPADPSRVHVVGFSAGGAAAAVMAAAYPDLYASAGVHSGLPRGVAHDLPSALAAMQGRGARVRATDRPTPMIVFHGDRDPTVHPRNGEEVLDQSRARSPGDLVQSETRGRSPGGRSYTRTIHVAPSGAVMFEHWLVHGAGHAWSGGSGAGSYTDPAGPDATGEMLRFFRSHRNVGAS